MRLFQQKKYKCDNKKIQIWPLVSDQRKYKCDERKYRSDYKAPSTKEKHHPQWGFIIKDNEARLKSAQLLWNKEKQGGGKILENITLIRPHIKLGKAKYWLLFPENFISSHVIYLVLLKRWVAIKFWFPFVESTIWPFCRNHFGLPVSKPCETGIIPWHCSSILHKTTGNLLVVNLSKTYSHSTHPSRAESFYNGFRSLYDGVKC